MQSDPERRRRLGVDRVEYNSEAGARSLSVNEFVALPLDQRLRGILEKRFAFFDAEVPVAHDAALAALRGVESRTAAACPAGVDALLSSGPDHALGQVAGTLLGVWRDRFTCELSERVGRHRELMSRRGQFRGAIHLVESTASPPDSEERATMRRVLSKRSAAKPPIALIVLGTGFTLSALRAVATAVFAVQNAPTRLFANEHDAITWFCAQASTQGVPAAQVTDALASLRDTR